MACCRENEGNTILSWTGFLLTGGSLTTLLRSCDALHELVGPISNNKAKKKAKAKEKSEIPNISIINPKPKNLNG